MHLHKEELERRSKAMEKELQDRKKEMESATIQRTDLEEEFMCAICHCIMLAATTLECSHSFCSECLEDWMVQKKVLSRPTAIIFHFTKGLQICPACRKPITRVPVRALNLDNIIEKIVQKMLPEVLITESVLPVGH